MNNLNEASERICELKGSLLALDALAGALMRTLPARARADLMRTFDTHAEVARTVLLHAQVSDHTIAAFERDIARTRQLLSDPTRPPTPAEPVLLTTVPVHTFDGARTLTGASGFFFERDERLFLVTSRHVLFDEPSAHRPDRIEIELHTDAHDLGRSARFSILLYREGQAIWRQATDGGGPVDVAAIEIDRAELPEPHVLHAFTPQHLLHELAEVEVGSPLLIVGFPLGFHDTLHHLPVARQAAIASAFGVRFQGQGYFLTDGRMHRGASGAPVLLRDDLAPDERASMAWTLLGVHSARLDMASRDRDADESLGLNCAWYADILLTLTVP